ncbi:MAG: type II secretion system F family protein [Armatimonadetes bacterium]|nr:type II secretion system F family protein [Armatimonadota bacterium]MBS1711777.1 type II secretion system F family protein [Armatimonadota bacterium]MBX3109669.1 type II secretion system F family protein [Fimbriimonadaceae bacterium]
MPTFAYSAVEPSGRKRTGVLEASDQQAAVALLTREGKFLLEIKEQAKASESAESHDGERKRANSTRADLALFTRRMADLSDAGLPLDRVLSVLAEQSESLPLSKAAEAALVEVQGGLSVSDALAMQGTKLFPEVYTQTLRAGEASGQFPESAERLADLLENEVTRRSQVVSALVYPAVLTGVAVFVVVFLLTFVVPRLSGVFKGMGDSLPAVTKALLATTGFITTNYLLIIGVLVGGAVLYRGWVGTPSGALARDRMLMKLPMAGPIVKKSTVSRYARVLGTLLHGGVSILEALDLSGKSTGNLVFATTSESVLQDVKEGVPIADAMKNTGAFPPVLTHMVAIGEETGDLPKMLNRVSESLDFEVEQGLRRLTASLEPIIVLVMGAFVAFVVLSIMLPIVQAQELVK